MSSVENLDDGVDITEFRTILVNMKSSVGSETYPNYDILFPSTVILTLCVSCLNGR